MFGILRSMLFKKFLPYQVFFTLGLFSVLIGIMLWPLYSLGLIDYPYFLHRHLMVFGGIGSFATGFILTSVPCFTGTKSTSLNEFKTLFYVLILFFFATFLARVWPLLYPISSLMICLSLATFFYRRAKQARYSIPKSFHLIGLAFIIGTLGSISGIVFHFQPTVIELNKLEQLLSFQACFLFLLIGVGSRLFTGIFGLNLKAKKEYTVLSLLTLIFISYLGEALSDFYPRWFLGIRAASLIVTLVVMWKIPKFPNVKSWEAQWAWAFWTNLLVGAILIPWIPGSKLYLQHAIFIGGFLGLTLVVASRIILAHGGYLMGDLQSTVRRLSLSFAFLLASLVLRCFGFISPDSSMMITLSSYLGLAGLGTWAFLMVPKIFRKDSPAEQLRHAGLKRFNPGELSKNG